MLRPPRAVCAAGPAAQRLADVWLGVPRCELSSALDGAEVLLSGTGHGMLEHEARREATARGLKNVAVLDHYANWESRFTRDGLTVLPDTLIVADAPAEALARQRFPVVPVVRWPNLYLAGEVAAVHALRPRQPRRPPERIVVVIEPLVYSWPGAGGRPGEFVVIDYLLEHLPALGADPAMTEVRLRPHPSDPAGKYDHYTGRQRHARVCIAPTGDLSGDLAWADLVAGTNTYAMVVAVEAGRPTICILPPPLPRCVLPFDAIEHLRDAIAAHV